MTAERPVVLTDRSIRSIGDSLREFGYSTLTDDEVRTTANGLMAGTVTEEGDIIAMFIAGMLREAGVIS